MLKHKSLEITAQHVGTSLNEPELDCKIGTHSMRKTNAYGLYLQKKEDGCKDL